MKIAIIGAGFTGLTAGYELVKKGHNVTIYEKDPLPGGLAVGYQEKEWKWSLEAHYHHWFTNDQAVLGLAKKIGHNVLIPRPKTSSFVDDQIVQFDSPTSLLTFDKLSLFDRVRMGTALALLRYNPIWKPFEKIEAEPFLKKTMGRKAYELVWEPLMKNKLGKYSNVVSLAWFWARVYKRTPSLAYPEGGFLKFAQALEKEIIKNSGAIHYRSEISAISSNLKPSISYNNHSGHRKSDTFDKILVTLPTFLFTQITPSLPSSYLKKYGSLKSIAAINMIMRLKKPLMNDGTYWLSMCDKKSPILAIVEHTNFMNKKYYNNEHIVYLGNYLETSDTRYTMSDKELLKLYDPWIQKINPQYKSTLISVRSFHAPFAQPIVTTNYSQKIPPFKTPLNNVYLANIQQVYPWDRGTNYAVELGYEAARKIIEEN
jgi:protoporphyrinogen oxidase